MSDVRWFVIDAMTCAGVDVCCLAGSVRLLSLAVVRRRLGMQPVAELKVFVADDLVLPGSALQQAASIRGAGTVGEGTT
jgi:hypothetical protein